MSSTQSSKLFNDVSVLSNMTASTISFIKTTQSLEKLVSSTKELPKEEFLFEIIRYLNNSHLFIDEFVKNAGTLMGLLSEKYKSSKNFYLIWIKYLNVANKIKSTYLADVKSEAKFREFNT